MKNTILSSFCFLAFGFLPSFANATSYPEVSLKTQFIEADAAYEGTAVMVQAVDNAGIVGTHVSLQLSKVFVGANAVGQVVDVYLPGGMSQGHFMDRGFPVPEVGDSFVFFAEVHDNGTKHLALYGPQSIIIQQNAKAVSSHNTIFVELPCEQSVLHASTWASRRVRIGIRDDDEGPIPVRKLKDRARELADPQASESGLSWGNAVDALERCAAQAQADVELAR